MSSTKSDPDCLAQRALLDGIGYRYDELLIIDRLDNMRIRSRLLDPRFPFLLWEYQPSLGVQAVIMSLAMGADRVAISGVSFRSSGCSYSDLDYERIHVDADLTVLGRITRLDLPVFAVDEALAADTGLRRWTGD